MTNSVGMNLSTIRIGKLMGCVWILLFSACEVTLVIIDTLIAMFTYLLCATCLECNAEQQFAVKLFLHVRRNSNAVNTFVTVVVRDFSCGELVISWAAWRVHLDRRRCWQLQNDTAVSARRPQRRRQSCRFGRCCRLSLIETRQMTTCCYKKACGCNGDCVRSLKTLNKRFAVAVWQRRQRRPSGEPRSRRQRHRYPPLQRRTVALLLTRRRVAGVTHTHTHTHAHKQRTNSSTQSVTSTAPTCMCWLYTVAYVIVRAYRQCTTHLHHHHHKQF